MARQTRQAPQCGNAPPAGARRDSSPTDLAGARRGFACHWWLHGVMAVLLVVGHGQIGLAQRDALQTGIESVYLDTDAAAAKKLGAARDLLAAGQWEDAIDLIRQIGEQHGDRLVGIAPGRYVSVQTYCDILLSSLPAEGLALYRTRIDPVARRWFDAAQAARDEAGLQKLLHRAFLSSSGDDALLLLGELAWEQGNLTRARGYWEQLLPPTPPPEPGQLFQELRYPDAPIDPAQIRARLVLCSLMQGQLQRGRRELETFRAEHPNAQGRLAGRAGNLTSILLAELAEAERMTLPSGDARVRTFAGNPARNAVQAEAIDVGSIAWSVPLDLVRIAAPPELDEPVEAFGGFGRRFRPRLPPPRDVLCYYPVVFNNQVFYCDEAGIYARTLLGADGGGPAWGDHARIYSMPQEPAPAVPAVSKRVGFPRYTVSIDGARLYARLGNSSPHGRLRALRGAGSLLVSLDLERQGDLAWTIQGGEVDGPAGPWAFDGTPLAVQGRVYVPLRRSEPQLQLNVACFDAESAKLLWNRKVCLGLEAFGPEFEELHNELLTYADERLYFCTNLGVVAALDARDGTVRWVASYPRGEISKPQDFNTRQEHGPNPCVVNGGVVFVAPTDADRVLAYDAATGILRWQCPLRGPAHQLVGVVDGMLVVAGDLLWGLDADTGRIVWTSGQQVPDAVTRGRAAVGGGLVYWPRNEELLLVDAATGQLTRRIDLAAQHGLSGGGNVTLADGMLLLAQSNRLAAFSEFGSLRQRRQDQLTQRPNDPHAAFEWGLLADALGESQEARAAFLRARELARSGDQRDGVRLADQAAQELSRLLLRMGEPEVSPEEAQALLAAWQTLLESSSAEAPLDPSGQVTPAMQGVREMERLIARYGPRAYEPIERRAEQALAEALSETVAGAAEALLAAIPRRYPHAVAGNQAALEIARRQRDAGDLARSDSTYRRLLAEGAPRPATSAAQVGLALNAERRGAWRRAREWWTELGRTAQGSEVALEGAPRPVDAVVAERLAQLPSPREMPPKNSSDLVPLLKQWDRALPSEGRILFPEGESPQGEVVCLQAAGGEVTCLAGASGAPLWQATLLEPAEWAAFLGDLLIVGTRGTATALTPEDGRTIWHRVVLPAETPETAAVAWRGAGALLLALCGQAEAVALDPSTGEVVWRYRPAGGTLHARWHVDQHRLWLQRSNAEGWLMLDARDGTLLARKLDRAPLWTSDPAPFDRWLACTPGTAAPVLIDAEEGRQISRYQGPVSHVRAPPSLIAGEEALLAVLDGDTLVRIDPATGRRMWSCRAGVTPLANPHDSVCLDRQRAFVVASGVLRAVALEEGNFLWEQYLGPAPDQWRIECQDQWLIATRQTGNDPIAAMLCHPATGEVVEQLTSPAPARRVQFRLAGSEALLSSDTSVAGYRAADFERHPLSESTRRQEPGLQSPRLVSHVSSIRGIRRAPGAP
ncbi:MAG: PQQ-binding-like beta-propeller repeat protein [Planctomycetales bacterium]